MKLGVLTAALHSMPLEKVLSYLHDRGVQTVEIGTGGYTGKAHLDPAKLLGNGDAIREIRALFEKYEMEISALSPHGNPVHPDKEAAERFHRDFEDSVLLAEQLNVDTIVTFSGCPGDCPASRHPNWVVCPWPEDFLRILDYQWNEVLIPYWKKAAAFAKSHGVTKIALEMHPGFCVYNPETLLRLREAVGDSIGANFDPSHLVWQGMNPVEAIRSLGDAIYHFHAKDTHLDKTNGAKNGYLDTKPYSHIPERAWSFRTVGYGHDTALWKEIMSALRMVGYDGAISIEHEDALMNAEEGLNKAIAFLKDILIFEKNGEMFWV